MANSKNKTEDELDAVSAAYESISAKLEDLRKKQAELEEASTDEEPSAVSRQSSAKSKDQEDEEAIEEFDAEDDLTEDRRPKAEDTKELEVPPPLPGTDEEPPLPKKQVYQVDDPLDEEESSALSHQSSAKNKTDDDEAIEEFDTEDEIAEDSRLKTEDRQAKQKAEDEMQKWEQLNQGKSLSGQSLDQEAEEPVATKPTFTPLSQDEFQTRLRRPQEDEPPVLRSQSTEKNYNDNNDTNSLDDLAEETVEPKEPNAAYSRVNRPTTTEDLEDDWDIRHLKPKHNSSFGQEDDGEFDTPQREFRRPPVQEENYFDRRNQPLPRKKASLWHLLILLLIGAGVIGATVYFLKYQFNEPAKPTPSPEIATPTPVATPTPTPIPTISDRSAFTVRVLNGTSKTGLATTILTKLKDAGFKTDRSGNATNSAFEQTIIRVKDSSQSSALIETVSKDLGSEYSPISETTLKSTDKADIEVILGLK